MTYPLLNIFSEERNVFHCIISLTMYFENVSNYRLRVTFIELAKGPRVYVNNPINFLTHAYRCTRFELKLMRRHVVQMLRQFDWLVQIIYAALDLYVQIIFGTNVDIYKLYIYAIIIIIVIDIIVYIVL